MRLAAAVVTAYLLNGAAVAGEPPLITAVGKCPAKSGCVVVSIDVTSKDEEPTRVVGSARSECGGKVYRVRGRLRGSAVRTYHLALQGECLAACTDGHAAYFGRTPRNAPIILTNRGRFEVVDNGVEVGVADDLIVLDEGRRAAAKYIGNYAGSGDYFVARSRVYMRQGNGPCVTAPQTRPGLLAIVSARHCAAWAGGEEASVAFTTLTPPSRDFVRAIAERYKAGDTLDGMSFRSRAGLVLVQFNGNCYQ